MTDSDQISGALMQMVSTSSFQTGGSNASTHLVIEGVLKENCTASYEFKISIADMIGPSWLEFELEPPRENDSPDYIAHRPWNAVKTVQFYVGDELIDSHSGTWLYITNELQATPVSPYVDNTLQKARIPLAFYFCKKAILGSVITPFKITVAFSWFHIKNVKLVQHVIFTESRGKPSSKWETPMITAVIEDKITTTKSTEASHSVCRESDILGFSKDKKAWYGQVLNCSNHTVFVIKKRGDRDSVNFLPKLKSADLKLNDKYSRFTLKDPHYFSVVQPKDTYGVSPRVPLYLAFFGSDLDMDVLNNMRMEESRWHLQLDNPNEEELEIQFFHVIKRRSK